MRKRLRYNFGNCSETCDTDRPCVYVSTTFVVLRWQHVMRQEGSHPDLRYESKMLKVAPQDNTTIDFVFFGVVAVDLVFVERIL